MSTPKEMSNVDQALDQVLARVKLQERDEGEFQLDIDKEKLIIFSDLHRGARNRADDFQACERAYNAALSYYYHLGYTLVSLGDMEELWEERPRSVVRAYQRSLQLEAKFQRAERLIRIWGNHDDHWQYPREVEKYLARIFGSSLKVREGLLVHVQRNAKSLGQILLVHGHQGTITSDRFKHVSRFLVRYIWRPLQRLTNSSLNTPAKDWELRQGHNLTMHNWSSKQKKLVLIAGHTHRPVFRSQTHEAKLTSLLESNENALDLNPGDEALQLEVSKFAAELEWVRAQQRQEPRIAESSILRKPSYFNSGCCCYLDGDITGIEISDGHIKLVRWPNNDARPLPQTLESADLATDVFAHC